MKIDVTVAGDLRGLMRREAESGKASVTRAMTGVGALAKAAWKQQIVTAGLGTRLSNTIKAEVYPKGQTSMSAAALIYTKAPKIIGANATGALIRSQNGFWLAIPTRAAGKSARGGRITPAEWEQRTGRRLTFIYRKGRNGLLVDTGTVKAGARTQGRDGFSRAARASRKPVWPMFILVRQTKLPKRLDLNAVANEGASRLATMIVRGWRD